MDAGGRAAQEQLPMPCGYKAELNGFMSILMRPTSIKLFIKRVIQH